ncbi:MAG: c-type cytochrome [Chloroflexi bacterium]|nr:c-type cytochrome [Chloroflexota bacterium]
MQKNQATYTGVILWSFVVLLIAAPGYLVFDLLYRQSAKQEAFLEEDIKMGSYVFASSQCWNCHGFVGQGGVGLPLNKTEELRARENKQPFIINTITRGRLNTQMPVWGKAEGGPLDAQQIAAVRAFLLDGTHWGQYWDMDPKVLNADGKIIEGKVGAKTWKPTETYLKDHALLPPCAADDLVCKGKIVFGGPCQACHNTNAETKVGPGLAGIFQKDKLPNGKPVNDANVMEWIQKGSASYKTEGAPFMPSYELQVKGDDLKNVIEYLKTLKK